MKKLLLVLAILLFAAPAWAQPLLVANAQYVLLPGEVATYNVQTGNAVCTAAGVPVAGCTGLGTGNLTAVPSSFGLTNIPADATGNFAFALSIQGLAPGTYTVTATECVSDPIWTIPCSVPSAPLTFTVPATPSAPTGLKLSPTN